ncbi:methyl-accepting chemotaxis protein [Saccharospirillum impatiens]|uniref:methyl-accepting chemotaxis protein n=1 Tax=Saccharospirillum impatiens TaxID=169438 RepID=UPI0003F56E58|nr:methyl-accepting chemotaxis protein [Saccharospirillum impatiens]
MKSFKHWSLKNKIRLPLLVLALFIFWMSIQSYRAMNSIESEVASFDQQYFPAISAALNADRDLYQALVAMRSYVELAANSDPETLESLNTDRLDNYQQALDRGLNAIQMMGELLEPNTASRYRAQMQAWLAHSDQVIASANMQDDLALFDAPRDSLNALGERLDQLAKDAASDASETLTQQTSFQLVQVGILVVFFVVIGITLPMMLVRPIELLRDKMNDIAQGEGDLTARLTARSQDELGQLADAFNAVIEKLQKSISVVKEVNVHLEQGAASLREAASGNIQLADEQHQTVDQVVTAVEEMHGAAREIANNSNSGADAANDAQQSVGQGTKVSQKANERVAELSERLNRSSEAVGRLADEAVSIASVLDVIRGIAEQTNLLALNAAIEAARAGEQGRGFAVVADEVRALASKTQQSTEDIQKRIETLQSGVDDAVGAMKSGIEVLDKTVTDVAGAADSFSSIEGAISQITDMSMQIATATEEQTHVVEEINKNLQMISDYSSRSSDQSRNLSELAENLKHRTDELSDVVGRFKV